MSALHPSRRARSTFAKLACVAWLGTTLGPLGCIKPLPALPTTATAPGLTVCQHMLDEGTEDRMRGLMEAVEARFKSAGYVLMPPNGRCDLRYSLSYTAKGSRGGGDDAYRDVHMPVRTASGELIDNVHLAFEQADVPVAEPDRLAIFLVNAVNASSKVAELGATRASAGSTPPFAPSNPPSTTAAPSP